MSQRTHKLRRQKWRKRQKRQRQAAGEGAAEATATARIAFSCQGFKLKGPQWDKEVLPEARAPGKTYCTVVLAAGLSPCGGWGRCRNCNLGFCPKSEVSELARPQSLHPVWGFVVGGLSNLLLWPVSGAYGLFSSSVGPSLVLLSSSRWPSSCWPVPGKSFSCGCFPLLQLGIPRCPISEVHAIQLLPSRPIPHSLRNRVSPMRRNLF